MSRLREAAAPLSWPRVARELNAHIESVANIYGISPKECALATRDSVRDEGAAALAKLVTALAAQGITPEWFIGYLRLKSQEGVPPPAHRTDSAPQKAAGTSASESEVTPFSSLHEVK